MSNVAAKHIGTSQTGDPLLLTPGPLTTSWAVKAVMVHDWGSRDAKFLAINREVMERLPEIVHGLDTYVTVPMQGSGTFAVEAMLTTFVPPDSVRNRIPISLDITPLEPLPKTFELASAACRAEGHLAIGVHRKGGTLLNTGGEFVLAAGDRLITIGAKRMRASRGSG